MRRQIVAGNWKMNLRFSEAEELLNEIAEGVEEITSKNVELIVCPPFTYLEMAMDFAGEGAFSIGTQNVNEKDFGAYTGEISAPMLKSMEIEYCIVGHSERRKYYGETDETVFRKVEALQKSDLTPIVCIGETLEEREANNHFQVIKKQLENYLFTLQPLDFSGIIFAYEPVWAIGTGKTATPNQAQEIHAYIRGLIQEKFGKEIARKQVILYGGSCNATNAKELFAQADVDGGLIGGASLNAPDFIKIANSFAK